MTQDVGQGATARAERGQGRQKREGESSLGHRDSLLFWENRIEHGQIPLVLFLYGEDKGRLLTFLGILRAKCLDEATRAFNMGSFDAKETPPGRIVDTARTFPVLSSWRLVVVNNASVWGEGEWAVMMSYLKDPTPSTCLVFRGENKLGSTEVIGAIRAVGAVLEFRPRTEREAEQWVVSRVRALGKRIVPEVARALIAEVGTMQEALECEVEKLLLYCRDKATIGEEDMREVMVGAKRHRIFDLADALGERRQADALRIVHKLLEEKDAHLKVLGMLGRQVRMIWHAKEVIGGKSDVEDALSEVPAFARHRLIRQAQKWDIRTLRKALEGLVDLDRAFKGGRLTPEVLLDKWILEICQG